MGIDLQEKFSRETNVDVDADTVAKPLAIPEEALVGDSSAIHFIRLALADVAGQPVSMNFYWLSPKKSVYNWGKTSYRFTPVTSYEDLTALQTIPKASVTVASPIVEERTEGTAVRVKVRNPSEHLAFQVHLGIQPLDSDRDILPVLWEDNYIELTPGESRELTAQFLSPTALNHGARLRITGWNIEPETVPITQVGGSTTSGADK